MIDWNKPIEFFGASSKKVYPARLICADRNTRLGLSHIILYENEAGVEHPVHCYVDGVSTSGHVRNIVEKKEPKRFWTVTMMKTPTVASKVFDTDPGVKPGDKMTGYTGYKVLSVTETEIAA